MGETQRFSFEAKKYAGIGLGFSLAYNKNTYEIQLTILIPFVAFYFDVYIKKY